MHLDIEGRLNRWIERLTLFRAVRSIILVAATLAAAASLLERLVEPKVFTSIWLAAWWACVTISTVGYGDVVPTSTGGRIVAVALMFAGISLIPLTASLVVSVLVGKRTAATEKRLQDMLERIEQHLARIESQ
ncbi:MAG TPA: potassium channel family protein [Gaiellaceae bacterium]|jgi:voltage-gated potassium channel|nr:potassium channel family protein [Gaiellaceae bacterium]